MKNTKLIFSAALLAIFCLIFAPAPASAQTATTATTLNGAVNAQVTFVTLTSATNVLANGALYTEDGEVMIVNSNYTSGTRIPVTRGQSGTLSMAHPTLVRVWIFTPGQQMRTGLRSGPLPGSNPQGACTATNELLLPVFNTTTNTMFTCTNSRWMRTGLNGGSYFCGALSGATGTCTTATGLTARTIGGVSTLASNAQVVTFTTGFTATTTYSCVANDVTTRANVVQMVPTSATTATITNTTGATDVVNWICSGY